MSRFIASVLSAASLSPALTWPAVSVGYKHAQRSYLCHPRCLLTQLDESLPLRSQPCALAATHSWTSCTAAVAAAAARRITDAVAATTSTERSWRAAAKE
jgi:hypothetical protein